MSWQREPKPMVGNDLELGTTYEDRYLYVTGSEAKIAVQNAAGQELALSLHEGQRLLANQFPKGQPVMWGVGVLAAGDSSCTTESCCVCKADQQYRDLSVQNWRLRDFYPAFGCRSSLDPKNHKSWFRLVSALAAQEAALRKEGKRCSSSLAARVAARARSTLPSNSRKELERLESILKSDSTTEKSHIKSYAEWCVTLSSPVFVLYQGYIQKLRMNSARKELLLLSRATGKLLKKSLDPLNDKAWVRRVRCMQFLGFAVKERTAALERVRSCVLAKLTSPLENCD
ncbi:hypothetical protein GQ600_1919 [Phytophthora cactorum]|nr:hypothetical protein GQ600_1919 [Phytophthora cactorum]